MRKTLNAAATLLLLLPAGAVCAAQGTGAGKNKSAADNLGSQLIAHERQRARRGRARRRRAAATYEAKAAQHLKNLAAAEQKYFDIFGDYAFFDQLIAAGLLLNKGFAGDTPIVDGYVFRLVITPRAGERPPSYSINADPLTPGSGRHLYLDSEVIGIRYNEGQPANSFDRRRE